MTRLPLAAALSLAVLALLAGSLWAAGHYRARAVAAEGLVAGYREAARTRAAQDRRQAALRGAAAALDHDLAAGEGADAPLTDYLSGAAGRLWGR